MFFKIKHFYLIILLIIFVITTNCQLQEPYKNHGIVFLKNRSDKLLINETNQNDVLKIIGQPHSKSVTDESIWIYIERTLTKGKYHKLGRHVLKTNNTLVLEFDRYGVLKSKKFYDKEALNKMKFTEMKTENNLSKRSFVESFLSSVKEKMYNRRK